MKLQLKLALLLLMATFFIIAQCGCAEKAKPVTDQSFYFDTTCQISIYDMENMSEDRAKDAISSAFLECSRYELMLSKTKKGSDIYRINHAKGKPVKCEDETIKLLKQALEYCKKTDGRFDVTIGKAVDLWDYHAENPTPPAKDELAKTMRYVDYKQIVIDGSYVSMETDQGEIDLGAIAKGYIADEVAKSLKEAGVTSAIISLGGNIVCIGDKGGTDFNIGIEKPYSNQSEILASTPLSDGTIVTSGTYERYFEYEGKKYHHILDSRTGYPVKTDVIGVSIKGPFGHSSDCDALSTTCLILGEKEGMKLIESLEGYEALFILSNNEIIASEGFEYKED